MVKRKFFAGVSAVALVGSGAGAAVADEFNWTGPYVGAHGGYGFGAFGDAMECYSEYGGQWKTMFMLVEEPGDDLEIGGDCHWSLFVASLVDELREEYDGGYFFSYEETDPLANGFLGGVQIGYRLQPMNGAVVFGVEVAHSITAISQYTENTVAVGTDWWGDTYENKFSVQGTIRLDGLTTATAQLGFSLGNVLFYGEAGGAIGQFSYTNTLGFDGQRTSFGLVYGGGIEVRATDRISLFAEYNRVQFSQILMEGMSNITLYPDECCEPRQDNYPTLIGLNFGAHIIKGGFNFNL